MIELVDRVITPADHVYLHILVPNPDGLLSPLGRASAGSDGTGPELDSRPDPSLAEQNGRRWSAQAAEDNIIVRRFVEAAERVDDLRIIERGLSVNDRVSERSVDPALIGTKLADQSIIRPAAASRSMP